MKRKRRSRTAPGPGENLSLPKNLVQIFQKKIKLFLFDSLKNLKNTRKFIHPVVEGYFFSAISQKIYHVVSKKGIISCWNNFLFPCSTIFLKNS